MPQASMDEELLPIKFQEHTQLQALGINAASIGFNTLTLESDKYICIRERNGEQNQVVIIDINDPDNIIRRPISAESAIMHPDRKMIALKAGGQLQVFNLDEKAKVCSAQLSEEVIFWKWISPKIIGLVTEASVYHWSIFSEGASASPEKVFDRHSSLSGCQIINYRQDPTGRWLLLVGISAHQGRVVGSMQLYNRDKNVSQPIEGHMGAFTEINLVGSSVKTRIFTFAVRSAASAKLHFVEIDHVEGAPVFPKKAVELFFPPEASNDFPVALQASEKFGVLYLVTKYGFIHIFEVETGECLFMNRISSETIFVTAEYRETGGIIGINRKGQVLSVSIDENTVVPYILQKLPTSDLAIRLAARANLAGAAELFHEKFGQYIQEAKFMDAAKLATSSPDGSLRTRSTIEALKMAPSAAGEISPLLCYFGQLLEKSGLNEFESIELAQLVLQNGKAALLEKWLKDNKLECSEELGDVVRNFGNIPIALSVYLRADVPEKVCECFAQLGQFSKIFLFAKKVGFEPDYLGIIERLIDASEGEKAVEFAKLYCQEETADAQIYSKIFDMFESREMAQQATAFIIDKLKTDAPEMGDMQTKVICLNLKKCPQVADAILSAKIFTHFDKRKVASLCEASGLSQKALELAENSESILKIIQENDFPSEWLANFVSALPVGTAVEILTHLLQANVSKYSKMAITAAVGISRASPKEMQPIADLFERFSLFEGLIALLKPHVSTLKDERLNFSYIKACIKTGNTKEAEKICRESVHYNPEAVKNFLMESDLADQLPLVIVCDRFNFIPDLVSFLYQRNMFKYIEIYAQKVNPKRIPDVVSALLDVGCSEDTIKQLLSVAPKQYSVGELVEKVELRNRLIMLKELLEKLKQENGVSDPAIANALAKIYIDEGLNAESFLSSTNIYDPISVGKYAEKRNPLLALIAYEKGNCDADVLRLTSENMLYSNQVSYLCRRRNLQLWRQALDDDQLRTNIIDQLVSGGILDVCQAEEVSTAVKALISAGLAVELIMVLEALLLKPTTFSQNKYLQNLLILTSIKAIPDKVIDLISRLNSFDGVEVGKAAVNAELYEEAFQAFKKFGNNSLAVDVLIFHLKDVGRAYQFAEQNNDKEVWKTLGAGFLKLRMLKEAIEAYIRANDISNIQAVVEFAKQEKRYEDLVKFLTMAQGLQRDQFIESELALALAMTNRLDEISELISKPNFVQISQVADKCYKEKLFQACKILYQSIPNHTKLAITYVHLKDYGAAVECAKKANNVKVWSDLNKACLEEREFQLAEICALNIVHLAEELEILVNSYEGYGFFDQLIRVLEIAIDKEHATPNPGGKVSTSNNTLLLTELAIVYSRHCESKLMSHLNAHLQSINIAKVVVALQDGHLWKELVHIYLHHEDYDKAIQTMIDHPIETWEHEKLCKAVLKCSIPDTLLKVINFYFEYYPDLIPELLLQIRAKIDAVKVIEFFQSKGHIYLAKEYMQSIQNTHLPIVNTTLNNVCFEEYDVEGLIGSIQKSDKFDIKQLLERVEGHEHKEFRLVAPLLYKIKSDWSKALEYLLKEKLYIPAIALAQQSKDSKLVETLLIRFAELNRADLYLGCLYGCFELVPTEVALEVAWRKSWYNIAMPFLCQKLKKTPSD